MSILKEMSEEQKLNHFANLYASITVNNVRVAHVVMSPEDWLIARDIPNIFSIEKNEKRFEKGCCAWSMGAYVWIQKDAGEIKAYGDNEFDKVENDFPQLAKDIKKLDEAGEITRFERDEK